MNLRKSEDDEKNNKSNLIFNGNQSFYQFHNIKKIDNLPFMSKYSFLANFFRDVLKRDRLGCTKEHKHTHRYIQTHQRK